MKDHLLYYLQLVVLWKGALFCSIKTPKLPLYHIYSVNSVREVLLLLLQLFFGWFIGLLSYDLVGSAEG